ncbi:hypothetical protein [Variovorax terrae]|uniref:Uncharacterized protein n=1 Tax=Variovorax terrae TaxID=2923278 RepID=A0A9X1VQM2_9BURK|nr:hypothetical protein [Variovorax terrae]MCJ0762031.1 hypothetical protein [Variovorax terrae]
MKRCTSSRSAPFLIAGAVLLTWTFATFPSESVAQDTVRSFPVAAKRGVLEVTAPPSVKLNGQADQLSPGARIRSPQNMVVMSATLIGQELLVNYVRDASGMIREAWILTPTEAREKRDGAPTGRNFVFSSEVDPTPRDDGKTPFNQLPRYGQ